MALAKESDQSELPDGMSLPEEFACREDRLKAIAAAKAKETGTKGLLYDSSQLLPAGMVSNMPAPSAPADCRASR